MNEIINVYCDESCHLANDQIKTMMLGAVTCPQLKAREIAIRIKEIKAEFVDACYLFFWADFVDGHPMFRNAYMGLKRLPIRAGKEATF